MTQRRRAELVGARMLSPSVRSLMLRTVNRSVIGHLPGQYVDIIVPTTRGLPFKRSYSVASPPSGLAADTFEIAVTRIAGGPTSEALHTMTLGDVLEIEGPAGTFVRRPSERAHAALFIATGTGLAPLRAMLAEEVATADGPPLALLFGCRTPHDVLWKDELAAWMRKCPRYTLHVSLSRPPPDWLGLIGYVQRHTSDLARALPGARAYVCGVSAMVDEVVRILEQDAHLPRQAVHYEPYD